MVCELPENAAVGRSGTMTLSATPSKVIPKEKPQLLVTTQTTRFTEDSCSGTSEKKINYKLDFSD